jgi:phage shock protein E
MVAEARGSTEQTDVEAVHVPGARLIPRGLLELRSQEELPDRDARIVVHCALGGRGALAAKTLRGRVSR